MVMALSESLVLPVWNIRFSGVEMGTGKKKGERSSPISASLHITLFISPHRSVLVLCHTTLSDFKISHYRDILLLLYWKIQNLFMSVAHPSDLVWGTWVSVFCASVQIVWFCPTAVFTKGSMAEMELAETKVLSKSLCCSELFYCSGVWERI